MAELKAAAALVGLVIVILTHTTGQITVSATTTDLTGLGDTSGIAISICDSGPGIDRETLSHIFECFYRGEETRSGIGLGLPIAKALVEAQNGDLVLESQPGHSTTATITLPAP